jgi:hypothetical protein
MFSVCGTNFANPLIYQQSVRNFSVLFWNNPESFPIKDAKRWFLYRDWRRVAVVLTD